MCRAVRSKLSSQGDTSPAKKHWQGRRMACPAVIYGGDSKIFKLAVKILRQEGAKPPMKESLNTKEKSLNHFWLRLSWWPVRESPSAAASPCILTGLAWSARLLLAKNSVPHCFFNAATPSEFDSRTKCNKKTTASQWCSRFSGDPYENRTRVTAVKGRCLNRLTNGPYI